MFLADRERQPYSEVMGMPSSRRHRFVEERDDLDERRRQKNQKR
jgi:hypothetical protein